MNLANDEASSIAEGPRQLKKQPSKVQRVKKPKREGLPKRPMSAYNVFFKEERLRWLSEDGKNPELNQNNAVGKSKFLQMSDAIAAKWKALKDRSKYEEIAREDNKRYRKAMEEYNESIIRSTRIGRAALDGAQLNSDHNTDISESLHASSKQAFHPSQSVPNNNTRIAGQPGPLGLDQIQFSARGIVSNDTSIQQLQHEALLRQFQEQQSNAPLHMLMNLRQQQNLISQLQLDQQLRYQQSQMQLQELVSRLQGSQTGGQVPQQFLTQELLLSLLGKK